jgi:hypothetical protein
MLKICITGLVSLESFVRPILGIKMIAVARRYHRLHAVKRKLDRPDLMQHVLVTIEGSASGMLKHQSGKYSGTGQQAEPQQHGLYGHLCAQDSDHGIRQDPSLDSYRAKIGRVYSGDSVNVKRRDDFELGWHDRERLAIINNWQREYWRRTIPDSIVCVVVSTVLLRQSEQEVKRGDFSLTAEQYL